MGGKEIRFAVGSQNDVRSSVWRLWANKDDVYLGAKTFLGAMKISFHKSGICRAAVISTTPRPALTKWRRPLPASPGFTNLFAVVVPPYLVKAPFREISREKKHVHFVQPPDDEHKLVFQISVCPPHHTEQDMLALPWDKEITIIGGIPLKTGSLWLHHYYDGFRRPERKLIQDYVSGLKIHTEPGNTRSGSLHWFDTDNPRPHLVDVRLGADNESPDPAPRRYQ
jgi:hypothetical protein